MIDQDHDGLISLQELKDIFSEKSVSSQEYETQRFFREIMREVDLNQDNFINFEEFNGALTNMLMDSLYNYTISNSISTNEKN